jgi:hypothetical protein
MNFAKYPWRYIIRTDDNVCREHVTNRELLHLDEVEHGLHGARGEGREAPEEPGDELRRQLLGLHALPLHRRDDRLVVRRVLRSTATPRRGENPTSAQNPSDGTGRNEVGWRRGRHLGLVLGGREALAELVEPLHLGGIGVGGGHASWAEESSRGIRGVRVWDGEQPNRGGLN